MILILIKTHEPLGHCAEVPHRPRISRLATPSFPEFPTYPEGMHMPLATAHNHLLCDARKRHNNGSERRGLYRGLYQLHVDTMQPFSGPYVRHKGGHKSRRQEPQQATFESVTDRTRVAPLPSQATQWQQPQL